MRRLERWAAGLSFGAALVHGMAGPAHVEEWWAHGVFFYGVAAAQAAYGVLLATQGIEGWGGWLAVRRRVYVAGIVGNVAVIVVWIVSRTVGVPFGPEAWERESVGVLDTVSKALEVALIVLLARLHGSVAPAPRVATDAAG